MITRNMKLFYGYIKTNRRGLKLSFPGENCKEHSVQINTSGSRKQIDPSRNREKVKTSV